MSRLKLFAPLLVFALLAGLLYSSLGNDPEFLPSQLVGKPLPKFSLPTLEQPDRLIGPSALIGAPALLNVWASWCYTCRIEHPFLTRLSAEGVPLYGLNYKNDAAEARDWLQEFGNPYRFSVQDLDGRLGIDLGVAGAPETFVVNSEGTIIHRHIGIVNEKVWSETLRPLMLGSAEAGGN